jgi:hypothetical protein
MGGLDHPSRVPIVSTAKGELWGVWLIGAPGTDGQPCGIAEDAMVERPGWGVIGTVRMGEGVGWRVLPRMKKAWGGT